MESKAAAHKGKGWEAITDRLIKAVNNLDTPVVFILWGKQAQAKANLVSSPHLVLQAAHPSGLSASRGFFGCKHFSKANDFLQAHGRGTIDWQIPS